MDYDLCEGRILWGSGLTHWKTSVFRTVLINKHNLVLCILFCPSVAKRKCVLCVLSGVLGLWRRWWQQQQTKSQACDILSLAWLSVRLKVTKADGGREWEKELGSVNSRSHEFTTQNSPACIQALSSVWGNLLLLTSVKELCFLQNCGIKKNKSSVAWQYFQNC